MNILAVSNQLQNMLDIRKMSCGNICYVLTANYLKIWLRTIVGNQNFFPVRKYICMKQQPLEILTEAVMQMRLK